MKRRFTLGASGESTTLQEGDRILFSFADWILFVQAWRGDTRLFPFSDTGNPAGDESWSSYAGPQPTPAPSKIPANWRELFKTRAESVAEEIALAEGYKVSHLESPMDFDFAVVLTSQ